MVVEISMKSHIALKNPTRYIHIINFSKIENLMKSIDVNLSKIERLIEIKSEILYKS